MDATCSILSRPYVSHSNNWYENVKYCEFARSAHVYLNPTCQKDLNCKLIKNLNARAVYELLRSNFGTSATSKFYKFRSDTILEDLGKDDELGLEGIRYVIVLEIQKNFEKRHGKIRRSHGT